ncbi:MAG: class I SAM-dependent DNA methyltransferase [Cellulosilyticaceae bacterium]
MKDLDIYNDFAKVYDTFMGDTPYENWVVFINEQIKAAGITPKLVCDLGCGTGKMCELFAQTGIDMIGIDHSEEMLMVARENAREKELDILYLCQDMTEFELYGTVDVVYSSCDCLNYLLEEEEVLETFKRVNNYLERGGLFIFDINTPYKYKNVLGERVFAEQTERAAYIWENFFDPEDGINEFAVSFFIQEEDGRYVRTEEIHYEKAYTIETMKSLLDQAGLELVAIYDDYNDRPWTEETLRATFVAREKYQDGKTYC